MTFDELNLAPAILQAVREQGYDSPTPIQAQAIPAVLAGHDLLAGAQTGTGKTAAFTLPLLHKLTKGQSKINKFGKDGIAALVLTPTRELAAQVEESIRTYGKHLPLTSTVIFGGVGMNPQIDRIKRGVDILVATPGRLLDHLQNTSGFNFGNLQVLIIDEADRLLEEGFEEEMHAIVRKLPKERQTALFSATQTKKVEDLAKLAIRGTPAYVGVDDADAAATVATLEQGYVVCPSEKRFMLLYTFLKKNVHKKVMVFFSSCNAVKFHSELLNYIDVPVMDIHGKQKQAKRTSTFFDFCKQKAGILLCTDVAARGLDIPYVDWIIQFDPPDDPKEYIHRVGRTARGASGKGRALLFLLPSELGFLKYLGAAKVGMNEYEFPDSKIVNVQVRAALPGFPRPCRGASLLPPHPPLPRSRAVPTGEAHRKELLPQP